MVPSPTRSLRPPPLFILMPGYADMIEWLRKNLENRPDIAYNSDRFNEFMTRKWKEWNETREEKGWEKIDNDESGLIQNMGKWRNFAQEIASFSPEDKVDDIEPEEVADMSEKEIVRRLLDESEFDPERVNVDDLTSDKSFLQNNIEEAIQSVKEKGNILPEARDMFKDRFGDFEDPQTMSDENLNRAIKVMKGKKMDTRTGFVNELTGKFDVTKGYAEDLFDDFFGTLEASRSEMEREKMQRDIEGEVEAVSSPSEARDMMEEFFELKYKDRTPQEQERFDKLSSKLGGKIGSGSRVLSEKIEEQRWKEPGQVKWPEE